MYKGSFLRELAKPPTIGGFQTQKLMHDLSVEGSNRLPGPLEMVFHDFDFAVPGRHVLLIAWPGSFSGGRNGFGNLKNRRHSSLSIETTSSYWKIAENSTDPSKFC